VYIYGSYRKIKTGVPFFLDHPVCTACLHETSWREETAIRRDMFERDRDETETLKTLTLTQTRQDSSTSTSVDGSETESTSLYMDMWKSQNYRVQDVQ